jgi:hypothetical protein
MLIDDIRNHLAVMNEDQRKRRTAVLLRDAAAEIERPRLTDAERLLIQSAAEEWEQHAQHWRDNDERVADEADSNAATLRGLLERTRQPQGAIDNG